MIFPHLHHSSPIEDLQWRPVMQHGNGDKSGRLRMMIGSLEREMQMQVWQMNEEFTEREIDILSLAE
jgi:hypothetical protein